MFVNLADHSFVYIVHGSCPIAGAYKLVMAGLWSAE